MTIITYGEMVELIIKKNTAGFDAFYEDYIIKLVGEKGLQYLRENNKIESCGVINDRKLYSWV